MKLSAKVPANHAQILAGLPARAWWREKRRCASTGDKPWPGQLRAVTSVLPAQSFVPSRPHVRDGWGLAAVVDAKILPWPQCLPD